MLAGEVLRAASTASTGALLVDSWCAALHAELLKPLGLNSTFCHRNEIPPSVAAAHLADVHKHDPCGAAGPEGLATFTFEATGGATSYAWGAADAAGSVISSASDMATILNLLLGRTSSPLLPRRVLDEIMTGHMVVDEDWMRECGVATDGYSTTGRGNAAGLGFDLACEVSTMLSPDGLSPTTQPCVHVLVFCGAPREQASGSERAEDASGRSESAEDGFANAVFEGERALARGYTSSELMRTR